MKVALNMDMLAWGKNQLALWSLMAIIFALLIKT